MNLDFNWLMASYLWGTIGFAYCVYGRKMTSYAVMIGGVLMVTASYFISSTLALSLACVAVIFGARFFAKQGY